MFTLTFTEPSGEPQSHPLSDGELLIGRDAGCDVVLKSKDVSRRHARFFLRGDALLVEDLGSHNGVFVRGARIGKPAQVAPGAPVEIGDVKVSVAAAAGARLRFGEVELLFWQPPSGLSRAARQKLLIGALAAVILAMTIAIVARPARMADAGAQSSFDEVSTLADQAQAAIESERFDEAARLAQLAIDRDPLAPAPRKALAQARREQRSQNVFAEAMSKAQVGREDEALHLLAQVPVESRFFPRARIKAKDLAVTVLRTRGAACRSAPRDNAPADVAGQCRRALDVKCQQGSVDDDAMLKALRAAEKKLSRRVPWSCPQQLGLLFRDEGSAPGSAVDEKALAALYLDTSVRSAVAQYARGDVSGALRTLSAGGTARKPGADEAIDRIKVVDGRFREGQTALMGSALDRADTAFGEALQADAALMPAGAGSFFDRQIRSTLSRAHGKAGDDKLQRLQYASAYDEYGKGLAVSPRDPHLLDQLARLEKVAENVLGSNPSCDQLSVAAHITGADPPSPAHAEAEKALERCR